MPYNNYNDSVFTDRALQNYLSEISRYRTLSREEEHDLAIRARDGDQKAINHLVQANLKFVVKIAARYQNRGLSLSELISEGNIGLIKAIEKFDPDKDIKLISYAIWWIRQRIMQAVSEKSSLIRVPMGKASSVSKIKAVQDRIKIETGNMPSDEELGDVLDIGGKAVTQLREHMIETSSLDDVMQTSDNQDYSARDHLEDTGMVDPQHIYYNELMNERLHTAINRLEPREASIIRTYFGLNESNESKNFAQIAAEMGLSRERVRQIQKEALKKILHHMKPEEEKYVDDFIDNYSY
ncbi:MAG: RNA polymerase sigma factor RpoD/SigA [Candidatus Cloacimonetes bacterium]|nr:RNA polymerase sigma factor RpoD/SigA [Candidatus Cloacimonadota bacterium]